MIKLLTFICLLTWQDTNLWKSKQRRGISNTFQKQKINFSYYGYLAKWKLLKQQHLYPAINEKIWSVYLVKHHSAFVHVTTYLASTMGMNCQKCHSAEKKNSAAYLSMWKMSQFRIKFPYFILFQNVFLSLFIPKWPSVKKRDVSCHWHSPEKGYQSCSFWKMKNHEKNIHEFKEC